MFITLCAAVVLDGGNNLQMSGQVFLQDYKDVHTVFEKSREDTTYQGSLGFTWEFIKYH